MWPGAPLPPSPVTSLPLKRKGRRFSPPPLVDFFTPGQRRGLLPERADIMESKSLLKLRGEAAAD